MAVTDVLRGVAATWRRAGVRCIGGGVEHRADDLVVAGAAAQVAGQPVADLVPRSASGLLLQQRLGGDDEARRADAALQGRVFQELLLQRVQPLRRRRRPSMVVTALPCDLDAQDQAGIDQPAVQDDVAGAAVAVVAAFLRAGQPQLVAQHFEQALPRLAEELGRLAVDRRLDVNLLRARLSSPSPARWRSAAPASSGRRPGAGGSRRRRACR